MEPAVACQQLVSQIVSLEEVHEVLELGGILGADIDGLTKEVLRVFDTADKGIDAGRAETGVDEDGAYHLSSGLQEHQTAIG